MSSEEEVLQLGTLVSMNTSIEVPTKYPLSQERIVVFEISLHSKSPMLYRPALHGNWNASSLARRALKDKFPTPTVPLTTVLQNRQVFLPEPISYFLEDRVKFDIKYLYKHHPEIVSFLNICALNEDGIRFPRFPIPKLSRKQMFFLVLEDRNKTGWHLNRS
jgi:hypothetical protein